MSVYRALLLSLVVLISACGGGDPDPCEPQQGQEYLIGCAQCIGSDAYPCPPLMPPQCGPSGCSH